MVGDESVDDSGESVNDRGRSQWVVVEESVDGAGGVS